jgi:hypothetical protein
MTAMSTWSHLGGTVRVVETADPTEGRSTLELWLRQGDAWEVRTVDSRDGIVGPPVIRDEPGTEGTAAVPTVTAGCGSG